MLFDGHNIVCPGQRGHQCKSERVARNNAAILAPRGQTQEEQHQQQLEHALRLPEAVLRVMTAAHALSVSTSR